VGGQRHPRVGQVADVGHEEVRLQDGVVGKDHVERRDEQLLVGRAGVAEEQPEPSDRSLVPVGRRRAHQEHSVEQLVTVTVVR
jgi:hypothetical protein